MYMGRFSCFPQKAANSSMSRSSNPAINRVEGLSKLIWLGLAWLAKQRACMCLTVEVVGHPYLHQLKLATSPTSRNRTEQE